MRLEVLLEALLAERDLGANAAALGRHTEWPKVGGVLLDGSARLRERLLGESNGLGVPRREILGRKVGREGHGEPLEVGGSVVGGRGACDDRVQHCQVGHRARHRTGGVVLDVAWHHTLGAVAPHGDSHPYDPGEICRAAERALRVGPETSASKACGDADSCASATASRIIACVVSVLCQAVQRGPAPHAKLPHRDSKAWI